MPAPGGQIHSPKARATLRCEKWALSQKLGSPALVLLSLWAEHLEAASPSSQASPPKLQSPRQQQPTRE